MILDKPEVSKTCMGCGERFNLSRRAREQKTVHRLDRLRPDYCGKMACQSTEYNEITRPKTRKGK